VTVNPAESSTALFDQLALVREEDKTYVSGIILYPIFNPGRGCVHFDFYQGEKELPVRLELFPQEEKSVFSRARLRVESPRSWTVTKQDQITTEVILRDGVPFEYWSLVEDSQSNP